MTTIKSLFIAGDPYPKGSMKAFVVKNRACVTHSSPKTMAWQSEVACAARNAGFVLIPRPRGVGVSMTFILPRPVSHLTAAGEIKKGEALSHSKKPDLDKLVRCVLDGLTEIAYEDDSQVCEISDTFKRYADLHEKVGVQVRIWGRE